jgi:hypothetical protein
VNEPSGAKDNRDCSVLSIVALRCLASQTIDLSEAGQSIEVEESGTILDHTMLKYPQLQLKCQIGFLTPPKSASFQQETFMGLEQE